MIEHDVDSFDEVANEFAELIRRGENPVVDQFADEHPDIADKIRQLFPILEMMERHGDSRDSWSANELENAAFQSIDDSAASSAPERLGDFRIIREIGRGGMGIVYEAEQESLGRIVALKVLPISAQFDQRRQFRFKQESRASAKLHHTNIVPVFGVGTQDGLSYFVMQYIDGKPLNELVADLDCIRSGENLEKVDSELSDEIAAALFDEFPSSTSKQYDSGNSDAGKIEQETFEESVNWTTNSKINPTRARSNYFRNIARIGVRTADALHYAHQCGVLHRDVKPSNLLLDRSGSVWVTDFGLAKYLDSPDFTKTGELVGTLRYMSPEQLDGESTTQSDVFGLGLTLFELLSLRPAYSGVDRKNLLNNVSDAKVPLLRSVDSSIPKDLETIVAKCTRQDPSQRYASANEVSEDLKRFLAGQTIAARRSGVIERTWKWCRRRPTVAIMVAALIASIFAGTTGIIWQWQKTIHALSIAEENLEKANLETARAEKHLQQAQDAVDQYVTSISGEMLLKSPSFRTFKLELLNKALDFQNEFVKSYQDDPGMRLNLADSYYQMAIISTGVGNREDALKYVDISYDLLTQLRSSKDLKQSAIRLFQAKCLALKGSALAPTDKNTASYFERAIALVLESEENAPLSLEARFDLGRFHRRLGLLALANSSFNERSDYILDHFTQAHDILVQLIDENPEPIDCQLKYIELLNDLATTYRRLGKLDETVKHYERASSIAKALLKDAPNNAGIRSIYAATCNSFGYFYGFSRNRDHDKAISLFLESLEHFRILTTQYPFLVEFQSGLSRAALNCGRIYEAQEKYDLALEKRHLAESVRRKAVEQYPEDVLLRSNWVNALIGLGATYSESKDQETALDYLNQALEQIKQVNEQTPGQRRFESQLATAHGQLATTYHMNGQHKNALRHFKWMTEDQSDPEIFYKAARALVQYASDLDFEDQNADEKDIQKRALEMARNNFDFLLDRKIDVHQKLTTDFYFRKDIKTEVGARIMKWLEDQIPKGRTRVEKRFFGSRFDQLRQQPGQSRLGLLTNFHPVLIEFLESQVEGQAQIETMLQNFIDCFCKVCNWNQPKTSFREMISTAMSMALDRRNGRMQIHCGIENESCSSEKTKRSLDLIWRRHLLQNSWNNLKTLQATTGKPYFTAMKFRHENASLSLKNLMMVFAHETEVNFDTIDCFRVFLCRAQRRLSGFVVSEVLRTFPVDCPVNNELLLSEMRDLSLEHYLPQAQSRYYPCLDNIVATLQRSKCEQQ